MIFYSILVCQLFMLLFNLRYGYLLSSLNHIEESAHIDWVSPTVRAPLICSVCFTELTEPIFHHQHQYDIPVNDAEHGWGHVEGHSQAFMKWVWWYVLNYPWKVLCCPQNLPGIGGRMYKRPKCQQSRTVPVHFSSTHLWSQPRTVTVRSWKWESGT